MKSSFLTKSLLLLSATAALSIATEVDGSFDSIADSVSIPSDNLDMQTGNITDIPRNTNTLDIELHPELNNNLAFQICYKITMAFVALLRLYLDVLNDLVDRMDSIPNCTRSFSVMFKRLFTKLNCKSEPFAFSNTGKFWNVVFSGQTDNYECVGDNQWQEIEKALTVAFNENDNFNDVTTLCLNLSFEDEWSVITRLQVSTDKTYADLWDIPCEGEILSYAYNDEDGQWANVARKML